MAGSTDGANAQGDWVDTMRGIRVQAGIAHSGLGTDDVVPQKDRTPDTVTCGSGQDVVFGATSGNTVTADCEEIHVEQPCRRLPQRVLAPLREAARCG